jgi:excisionase family DNA binding protein
MTLSEAADWLRLSADEVSRLAAIGDLPGQQVGREWRFLRSVLQSWLSMRTECRRSSAGR